MALPFLFSILYSPSTISTNNLQSSDAIPIADSWKRQIGIETSIFLEKREVLPCTRYFPKSRLNATFQMVINGTNPGLWSVFHIEALWRGNILARNPRFRIHNSSLPPLS
jgi:hypothetical protein